MKRSIAVEDKLVVIFETCCIFEQNNLVELLVLFNVDTSAGGVNLLCRMNVLFRFQLFAEL